MKRAMICVLAVMVTCGGTALYAQTSDAGMAHAGPPPHRMAMSPEQRLQRLTKALNLTSDQQQKVKPILENESQQMQAMRQDSSMSQQDRWNKIKSIHEDTTSQIKAVLNPDQQAKYEDMMSHHAPAPGEHGAGQAAPAPPQ